MNRTNFHLKSLLRAWVAFKGGFNHFYSDDRPAFFSMIPEEQLKESPELKLFFLNDAFQIYSRV